jgi:hypothetical protein
MEGLTSLSEDFPFVFDNEYFAGGQVSIYFGNIWIDDINAFSAEIVQNKEPIYGYSSELWDAVGYGPKLVRGSFAINFKEAGYLFAALHHLRQHGSGRSSPFGPNHTISRLNVEEIINGDPKDPAYARALREMAGFATAEQFSARRKRGNDSAEGVFEEFEDAIYRTNGVDDFNATLGLRSRSTLSSQLNGFDIFMQFGDHADVYRNHTIIKLENIQLVGHAMTIELSGRPIQQAYSFIARDWV